MYLLIIMCPTLTPGCIKKVTTIDDKWLQIKLEHSHQILGKLFILKIKYFNSWSHPVSSYNFFWLNLMKPKLTLYKYEVAFCNIKCCFSIKWKPNIWLFASLIFYQNLVRNRSRIFINRIFVVCLCFVTKLKLILG